METEEIFKIFAGIWAIDFITTVIALNFYLNMVERNPIAKFFYDKGLVGFIIFFTLAMIGLLIMSYRIRKTSYNKYNSEPELTWKIGVFVFCSIEIIVIINNMYWLTGA